MSTPVYQSCEHDFTGCCRIAGKQVVTYEQRTTQTRQVVIPRLYLFDLLPGLALSPLSVDVVQPLGLDL